jgi:NAD(P)-dependent dehydrogenase (short-subunit alcohol dehydrogenase family)
MTHILSKMTRGRIITVNAVAPGPVATDLFFEGKPQSVIDHLTKLTPLVNGWVTRKMWRTPSRFSQTTPVVGSMDKRCARKAARSRHEAAGSKANR